MLQITRRLFTLSNLCLIMLFIGFAWGQLTRSELNQAGFDAVQDHKITVLEERVRELESRLRDAQTYGLYFGAVFGLLQGGSLVLSRRRRDG